MLTENLMRFDAVMNPPPPPAPRGPSRLPRIARRALLAAATAALAMTPACGVQTNGNADASIDDPAAQWRAFRDAYVARDGRVIDTGNGSISHSEGQGYGMLFAEAFEDRATFERIYHWARRNLRRPDGLYSWRFKPDARIPVEDPNNATDGDIYIAWALLRAGERWLEPSWRQEGQRLAETILSRLVVEVGGRTLLLPGAFGFQHVDRVVVNPSYYAFPALYALSRAAPDRAWNRLMADGLTMIRGMRYGRWGLPADWAEVQVAGTTPGMIRPAAGWPARFSFDAARVPLHLAWAGLGGEPAVNAAATFWNDPSLPVRPAWIDLGTGQVAPFAAPAGIHAVAEVTTAAGWRRISKQLPTVARSPDYYSAALALLSRVALRETPRNQAGDMGSALSRLA